MKLANKYKQAVLDIASNVQEINQKLSYFLENYREDYYKALDGIDFLKQYKDK